MDPLDVFLKEIDEAILTATHIIANKACNLCDSLDIQNWKQELLSLKETLLNEYDLNDDRLEEILESYTYVSCFPLTMDALKKHILICNSQTMQ